MKIIMTILVLCTMTFDSYCQPIKYNFSSEKEGYFGKVKRITSYSSESDLPDSMKIDSSLRRKDKIQFVKFFNEKGLLVRLDTYNRLNDGFVKHYRYNDDGNIVSIVKEQIGSDRLKEDMFDYNHEDLTLTHTTSNADKVQIDGKLRQIFTRRLKFDKHGRHIHTEYLDNNGIILMITRSYYDCNSNVIQCETFEGEKFKDKYIQTFDSNGRKKIIQSIDKNGNFTTKRVYNWINDNAVTLEIYDTEGKLEIKHREIFIRDQYGNIVKKYFYDLTENTAITFEYEIEYY